MAKEILTDEMVEIEIERLLQSEDVKLAKQGLTVENIEAELFSSDVAE